MRFLVFFYYYLFFLWASRERERNRKEEIINGPHRALSRSDVPAGETLRPRLSCAPFPRCKPASYTQRLPHQGSPDISFCVPVSFTVDLFLSPFFIFYFCLWMRVCVRACACMALCVYVCVRLCTSLHVRVFSGSLLLNQKLTDKYWNAHKTAQTRCMCF